MIASLEKKPAVSGKPAAAELLRRLGAAKVIGREEVDDKSGKPMLAPKFAAAIDTVGGNTLSTIVRSLHRGGVVAACGLVGGVDLPLTVYPFILRNVDLVGIDSVDCPREQRDRIWANFADAWSVPLLDELTTEITLDDVSARVQTILQGGVTGRIVVRPTTA